MIQIPEMTAPDTQILCQPPEIFRAVLFFESSGLQKERMIKMRIPLWASSLYSIFL